MLVENFLAMKYFIRPENISWLFYTCSAGLNFKVQSSWSSNHKFVVRSKEKLSKCY